MEKVDPIFYTHLAAGKLGGERKMECETLIESAIRVLNTSDPYEKARLGDSIAVKWLQGAIAEPYDPTVDLPVPDKPAPLTNDIIARFGKQEKMPKDFFTDFVRVALDEIRHFTLLAAQLGMWFILVYS